MVSMISLLCILYKKYCKSNVFISLLLLNNYNSSHSSDYGLRKKKAEGIPINK